MELKLGKKPARKGAIKFGFLDYVDLSKFPKTPDQFGHEDLIKENDWGMLGNDEVGDCYFAGSGHEQMIWGAMGGNIVQFTKEGIISDYSAATGYKAGDDSTDQGTDMEYGAQYRRKTGIIDVNGNRHTVKAYLSIPTGNLQLHLIAQYLFGAVGIGIRFPKSAMTQFLHGQVWDIVQNSPYDGCHYIPLVAKRKYIECVTWGKIQPMTDEFFQRNNDESVVYLSNEMFINRKSPEGFDYDQLLADLQALNPNKHLIM